jgi:LysM repeat protein
MRKSIYLITLLVFIAAMTITACNRPASLAPVSTFTPTAEVPFPVTTAQAMGEVLAGTQTAVALLNTPMVNTQVANTAAPVVTATPQALPSPTPGRPSSYVVQKGDHFYCLARRFNVDLNQLASLNGFASLPNTLTVGMTLKVPSSGSFPGTRSLRSHPTTYTVAGGETINAIACKFGDVSPEAILAYNNLTSASGIHSGQSLRIP